ncbi:oxidoreductase [Bifidobacterium saguini DSM 23967]|uniref:Oxidoreductase n=2 Tax=Bifidobacterium saguini TaxID=762210 RepID=A0A087D7X3_9BIFI|nr:Coenzyme F420 hydrogenase/dehydrogenase, beta subunit C-terminal domain [Bifidobacterium saguini]KFI91623.1 oxidoreductase [Bifidobacterium saguini DSM 23967]QTB90239.1 Coenzyme F420 hydrogenase/dehydrogenase, beta subunit C-terminal domain [Bifidobacterium saguini]
MSDTHVIEQVIASPDQDAVDGQTTYCVGCGSCAYLDPAFRIAKSVDGCYSVSVNGQVRDWSAVERVCPFAASTNEDELGKELFSSQTGVQHNQYLGYFLNTYVGYVQADGWRSRGSSGGLVSWTAAKMLEDGLVDAVIHAKDGPDPEHMYTIQISHTVDELQTGAKSKYYPVEMTEALDYVREHEGRYLFVGIPCFVKAVRLLRREDPILNERIKYCIGLVCGHLKSDYFAKAEAWESGVPLDKIARVDFRHKTPGSPASDYAVEVRRTDGGQPVIKRTAELSVTNWGLGYFKYNACDYCDDVLAETADVTFGDAWIPKYVSDGEGCNVIIVRNQDVLNLFERHMDELVLHDSNADEVYQSQAGGFRHRRQGLAYRLHVHEKRGEWTPTKRVKPSLEGISEQRQIIYAMRTTLKNESFVAFREAVDAGNFDVFIKHMRPYEREYRHTSIPFQKRVLHKCKKIIKQCLQIIKHR